MNLLILGKVRFMKKIIFYTLSSLLFFSACSTSEKSEKENESNLSFHPEKGTRKEMTYDIRYESPSNKAVLDYHMNYTVEVTGSDKESTDLKFTFTQVSFDGKIDTVTVHLEASNPDTTKPELIYAQPYFASLNHEFLVKYDRKMHKISEEMLTPADPKSISQPVNRAPFFTSLPDAGISAGSKWKDKIELKSGEGMVVTAEFEVKNIEKDIVYIDFSGEVGGQGAGFGQDFSLKGKVNGKLEIDMKSGLTIHSEMVQDLVQIMGENESPLKITIIQNIK